MKKWDLLLAHIYRNISGFQIVEKESSRLMRLLSFLLFFNKKFMTDFTTTIYPKVYFPKSVLSSGDPIQRITILAHEYVHMRDRKRFGILFNIFYLSPQIFVPLALLAVWFSNLWLLCLLFLLPIPSIGRAYLEYRAYKMSIFIYYYFIGKVPDLNYYVEQFTTSNYYWMMPLKQLLYNNFNEFAIKLRKKEYEDYILEIKNVLDGK